jgi:hypothetical protein
MNDAVEEIEAKIAELSKKRDEQLKDIELKYGYAARIDANILLADAMILSMYNSILLVKKS